MSRKLTLNSQIRLATHNDVPSIINIMREVYNEHGLIFEVSQEIPDIIEFEKIYNQKSAAFFVLLVKEEIIGTVGVKIIESSDAEIVRLYLKRDFRGNGFGYQLLKNAVKWAQEQGKSHIELWSFTQFTQGHSLYKKFGFTQLDTRQMDDINKTQMYGFAFSI